MLSIFKHYQKNNLCYIGFPHSTFRSKAFILTCKSKVHRYSSQKPEDIVKSKRQESERNPGKKKKTPDHRYKSAKLLMMTPLSFVISNIINLYYPYKKQ